MADLYESRVLGENIAYLVHRRPPGETVVEVIEDLDGVRLALLGKKRSHLFSKTLSPRHQTASVIATKARLCNDFHPMGIRLTPRRRRIGTQSIISDIPRSATIAGWCELTATLFLVIRSVDRGTIRIARRSSSRTSVSFVFMFSWLSIPFTGSSNADQHINQRWREGVESECENATLRLNKN